MKSFIKMLAVTTPCAVLGHVTHPIIGFALFFGIVLTNLEVNRG